MERSTRSDVFLAVPRRVLPMRTRIWLKNQVAVWPPVGLGRVWSLGRVAPLSREWGYERGRPVDRYYIERFLSREAGYIRGRVLEVAENTYSQRFGGPRVTQSDVLDVVDDNPLATVIADLSDGAGIPDNTFDCFILTQTLQLIYDVRAAVATLHRVLKPGGTALVTVPGISQISRYDMDRSGHYWSFTSLSARRLFEEQFRPDNLQIEAHGNAMAASAFLYGVAAEELSETKLDYHDPDYEVIITIRATKAQSA